MKQGTHMAVNAAVSLAIFRPDSLSSLALMLATSTIGSIISDIDVTTSESHKDIERIIIISFIAIVLCSIIEVYFNLGIYNWLHENSLIAKNLGLIFVFFCVCFFGMHQPHRSFMHSFTSVILLSTIVYFLYDKIAVYFAVGMLSHILLDLLNKKRVQLFYPLKFKICFEICESNGFGDKFVYKVASIIFLLEIIWLAVGNSFNVSEFFFAMINGSELNRMNY